MNERTKELLNSTMKEARNYYDFVVGLGGIVYYQDATDEVARIAARHAWELREVGSINKIASKYGENPAVKPWTFPLRGRMDRLSIERQVWRAIDDALAMKPDDWIRMELLLLRTYVLAHIPEGSNSLDMAKRLREQHVELECYDAYIAHLDARIRFTDEGDIGNAIRICVEALDSAEKFNDVYQEYWLRRWLGLITMNVDVREAQVHAEQAYGLCQFLGAPFHTQATLIDLGMASAILGEYDLALEFHYEGIRVFETQEGPTDRHAVMLSRIYSDLGDSDQALEWARWALDQHTNRGSKGDSWVNMAMARALIIKNDLERASEYLDMARELALRSGQEGEMSHYYYVSGLLELASDDPLTAIQSISDALEIGKRLNYQMFVGRCLLSLARAEIAAYPVMKEGIYADASGPWMSQLGQHATEKNLPGVLIQHALLKADFRIKQGQLHDARATLVEALDWYNSPGLKSLQHMIISKIKEIDALENERAHSNNLT
ncbi:MAG: tetratricopeptide repeat protein [Candidatus Thorarchaeota archaeon]